MAPKSACIIIFAILSVLAVAVPINAGRSSIGGWQPIKDVTAAEVVAIGKFAVAAYNNREQKQKKTPLNFVSVKAGDTQVVEGTNYRLVISAAYGGAAKPDDFNAVVYSDLKNSLKLISFRQAYCSPSC